MPFLSYLCNANLGIYGQLDALNDKAPSIAQLNGG